MSDPRRPFGDTSASIAAFNATMGQYQQEVVRWNRQINLVSRKDTLMRVAELIGQCRDAWNLLAAAEMEEWAAEDPLWYFDLGSGGGLPGFVWHQLMMSRYVWNQTWLVEPREKRAWFLERLNHITPDRPLKVWCRRWGEVGSDIQALPPSRIVVSIKALKLTDRDVLAGLGCLVGDNELKEGTTVVIARFYPGGQRWSNRLAAELGIKREIVRCGFADFEPTKQHVLAPARPRPLSAASLVVSCYIVSCGGCST